MYERYLEDFDLRMIMNSGQVFRIQEIDKNVFFIAAGDRGILVRQNEQCCRFSCSEQEFLEFWFSYFDLNTDYGKLKALLIQKIIFCRKQSCTEEASAF